MAAEYEHSASLWFHCEKIDSVVPVGKKKTNKCDKRANSAQAVLVMQVLVLMFCIILQRFGNRNCEISNKSKEAEHKQKNKKTA